MPVPVRQLALARERPLDPFIAPASALDVEVGRERKKIASMARPRQIYGPLVYRGIR